MNKRIRYIKDTGGGYKSAKVIKSAEGIEYRAFINSDGKTGYVRCPKNDAINIPVKGTSPHKVKIAIKTTLEFLKCKFVKESRTTKDEQHEKDLIAVADTNVSDDSLFPNNGENGNE